METDKVTITTISRLFLDESNGLKQNLHGNNFPNPIENFEQCFGQYPDLMEQIQNQGFTKPSPIQGQAWPSLLKGEDLVGIAQSGAGKTLAFLLPALIHAKYQLVPQCDQKSPNSLILAPTSVVVRKIEAEADKFSFWGVKTECFYENDGKANVSNIMNGVKMIIATPGRLNKLVEQKDIDICDTKLVILDKVDEMLNKGVESEIETILLAIRDHRQMIMTSATWSDIVRGFAQKYLTNPIHVYVNAFDSANSDNTEPKKYAKMPKIDEFRAYKAKKHTKKND